MTSRADNDSANRAIPDLVRAFVFACSFSIHLDFIVIGYILAGGERECVELCQSAALEMLLGNFARTEAQVIGLGVIVSNVFAGLGGCWWPIEITPLWTKTLALTFPARWTMDAFHKLMTFGASPASVLPNLCVTAVALGGVHLITVVPLSVGPAHPQDNHPQNKPGLRLRCGRAVPAIASLARFFISSGATILFMRRRRP
jgi:hypothetical protein